MLAFCSAARRLAEVSVFLPSSWHPYPMPKRLSVSLTFALLLVGCPGPKPLPPLDVTLDPPTSGYQVAPAPFDVVAGTETQRCFFFAVPSDVPVFVNRFQLAQNTGSHHLNVFRVKTIKALSGVDGDSVVDGECFKSPNWSDWPLVVNSQESNPGQLNPDDPAANGHVDWQLPDSVVYRFEPHELLMIQVHYVNATTQATPKRGKFLVNLHTIPAAANQQEVGTLFATNQSIKVCPGDTNKFFEASCKLSSATPVTLLGANGHFHSRGTKFTITTFDAAGTPAAAPFYTSAVWNDPPMIYGLNLPVAANAGVRYHCEYSVPATACGDPANGCCFTFGGHVETQEHCNAFVYYYPKTADVSCF